MGYWSLTLSLLLCAVALTSAAPRRSTSTDHLDNLSRDELLDILGQIENSAPSSNKGSPTKTPAIPTKSFDYSTYPPVTAPPRRRYSITTPQPSAPRYPTTRRPVPSSSDIDALINKYKNRPGQPGSPTVDDLLRRIRNGPSAPSAPSSTFNYPGPNYASNSRYPSSSSSGSSSSSSSTRGGSLPYPTSYNPALYPTRGPSYPPYPTSYGSSYPTSYGTPSRPASYGGSTSYGGSSYPTQPNSGSRLYPSLPNNNYSGGYSPSGTYGGVAPKYVTTTKKPKKNFLSKLFG